MHLYRNGALGKTESIEKIDAHAGPEQGWGVGIWCGNRPGASVFLSRRATTGFRRLSVRLCWMQSGR